MEGVFSQMNNQHKGRNARKEAEVSSARPREKWNRRRWRVEGQGLVEYALILVMVVIVIILILTYIGQTVATNMYSKINSGFPGVGP